MTVSSVSTSPAKQSLPIDNLRGAVWMVAGVLFFSATAVLIKYAGQTLHTFEVVFFRCLFGVLVVIPLLMQSGFSSLRIRKPGLHALRVLCAVVAMNSGFYALANIELATAVSLSFSRPLFMILLAVVILGEVVRWRRGLATVIGFCGVLIMLQPGAMEFEWAFAAALLGAFAVAVALVLVKLIAVYDEPVSIMVSFSLGTVLVSCIPAALVWQTPTSTELLFLIGLGIVASLGQYSLIRAFTLGEATVMSPIDYLQIILASTAGYFLFQEVPSIWTLLGALVIVGATLYIVIRGARVRAAPPLPPDPGAAS